MLNYCKIPLDFLKFEGNDRLDLINRLSTNSVNSLGKFKGIKTVLTSDKGRFVDLITLYNFGDFVFAACSFNNSGNVIRHLDKYTIMDDFKVTNMAGTHGAALFFGDDAGKFAGEIFGTDISGFSNNDFKIYSEEGKDAIIARNDDEFGGFYFIYSSEDFEFYSNKLFGSGKSGLKEITEAEYEILRIEFGIPEFGREMTDETNPLECGLTRYVSFTKGCYIGQEVIARLDSYDKISKHLVGIRFGETISGKFEPGEIKLSVDDKECGYITSTALSGTFGNIGLGFIRTAFLDFDKEYILKSHDGIKCSAVKLPFTTYKNLMER